MTADIWIRDYNPPMCFQKKISGRGKHNGLDSAGFTDIWQGVDTSTRFLGMSYIYIFAILLD
jgi:hypothetical protein